jgi:hypothetical protein
LVGPSRNSSHHGRSVIYRPRPLSATSWRRLRRTSTSPLRASVRILKSLRSLAARSTDGGNRCLASVLRSVSRRCRSSVTPCRPGVAQTRRAGSGSHASKGERCTGSDAPKGCCTAQLLAPKRRSSGTTGVGSVGTGLDEC